MARYCSKVGCWAEIEDGAYCIEHDVFAPTRKHREPKIDYKLMAKESQERLARKYAKQSDTNLVSEGEYSDE